MSLYVHYFILHIFAIYHMTIMLKLVIFSSNTSNFGMCRQAGYISGRCFYQDAIKRLILNHNLSFIGIINYVKLVDL